MYGLKSSFVKVIVKKFYKH